MSLLVLASLVSVSDVHMRSQVLHAHFKDWLARTGNLSQINDLLQFDLELATKTAQSGGATSPYSASLPVTPTKAIAR